MTTVEPCRLTIAELAARAREGSLPAVETAQSCLDAIGKLDGRIKAWVTINREQVMEQAERLDQERKRGRVRGPLHGVPIGFKDIYHSAGLKTVAGSKLLADFISTYDAAAVERLKQAGAIILGKTATTEFAFLDPAPTCNPWNLEHTPGGSSSGSAAAVAARMCPASLGSQTAGSTIRPAAYCGVVGIKPTFGKISRYGMIPLAANLDHVGIFARTVCDAAMILQTTAGYDPRDYQSSTTLVPDLLKETEKPAKPPRIGLVRDFFYERADDEVRENYLQIVEQLARAGASIEDCALPAIFTAVPESLMTILGAEAAEYHRENFENRADEFGPKLRTFLENAVSISAIDYIHALHVQQRFRDDLAPTVSRFDALLTPSVPAPAPHGLTSTGDHTFVSPWTFGGFPVVGLPSGLNSAGLPLAVQLIGAWHSETRLLRAAQWCEQVINFKDVPPVV